jgi:hypothetical protein
MRRVGTTGLAVGVLVVVLVAWGVEWGNRDDLPVARPAAGG